MRGAYRELHLLDGRVDVQDACEPGADDVLDVGELDLGVKYARNRDRLVHVAKHVAHILYPGKQYAKKNTTYRKKAKALDHAPEIPVV
jgi:hypothetical protein